MQTKNSAPATRDFILLWLGQSISSLGTDMTVFALILWAHQQEGTASSVTYLSAFSYLPSVLFCFLAGTLADRWDKKKILALGDSFAALCTLLILLLVQAGRLQVWHLYAVNFLLGLMSAFQNPVSSVVVTLLTPQKHFARSNGLYALSGAIRSILAPAAATAVFHWGGLTPVLAIDLITFALAILSLLTLVRIPAVPRAAQAGQEPFAQACLFGIRYLCRHKPLLWTIAFFAAINLLAYCGSFGLLSAYLLAAPGGGEAALAVVNGLSGVGALVGSALVSSLKPARSRSRVYLWACLLSCLLNDLPLVLGRSVPVWGSAAAMGSILLPFLNANLTASLRTRVPVELQGRVFAARDTLQYWAVPVGLFLGGALADGFFEPFMASDSGIARALAGLVGPGPGSGIAVQMLIAALLSTALTIWALRTPSLRELDKNEVLR